MIEAARSSNECVLNGFESRKSNTKLYLIKMKKEHKKTAEH